MKIDNPNDNELSRLKRGSSKAAQGLSDSSYEAANDNNRNGEGQ